MAKVTTVWGIDIGQCALKAIKLREVDGELQVEAFDIIEHSQILSGPDVDSQALVRVALEQFLARNTLAGSSVCVSVPGQSSFTRFVKLPPVETKKVPDIVRFEAEQQIPFPIVEVIWRWQTFHDPDSPDVEVGIFAMKRSDISKVLDRFSEVELNVDMVQMAPLALYNFMINDEQTADDGATLLADVGADKTDLVVADGAKIWTRTIQIGGNNFTQALVKAFKLSFAKAEKLKRTAASSKYARQIFQAMRPVFADLVQEIQRSIGYYTSLHRQTRFRRLVGLGNGFRLPGLQKFLEQNLGLSVTRIDTYNKLQLSPAVNAPVFTENVLSFAVAYGLAIQGLNKAVISTNLLPEEISRARRWAKKRPWFGAAAAVLLVALVMPLFRAHAEKSALTNPDSLADLRRAQSVALEGKRLQEEFNRWRNAGTRERKLIEETLRMYDYRDYWPSVQSMLSRGIADRARHQRLLSQYANAQSDQQRDDVLAKIKQIPRGERMMIFVDTMTASYKADVTDRQAKAGAAVAAVPARRGGIARRPVAAATAVVRRGFEIELTGRTPLPKRSADPFLREIFRKWQELADDYPMLSVLRCDVVEYPEVQGPTGATPRRASFVPRRPGGAYTPLEGMPAAPEEKPQAQMPDPLFPDDPEEDMIKDTRFVIRLVVSIDEPDQDNRAAGAGR